MKTKRIRPNGSALAAAQQTQNREITLTLSPALCAALEHYAKGEGNRIEEFCEWVVFDSARAAGEDSETLQIHASALMSKGARRMERRMNPPLGTPAQAGIIPEVKPDARRALAADLSMFTTAVTDFIHQSLAASLALIFEAFEEPGDFTAPAPPDAEAEVLLRLRTSAISGAGAGHPRWLESHARLLESEMPGRVPSETRARLSQLAAKHGLSERDALAEFILLSLAALSLEAKPVEVEAASAGGVA